jgi:hypothetical protein
VEALAPNEGDHRVQAFDYRLSRRRCSEDKAGFD